MDQAAWPRKFQAAQSKGVIPRKNCRNVVFIQNCGAMSPPDTLDLKETRFTAKNLDIQKINSDFYISKTLFPNYQKWAPRAALVRSMWENSLVHFSAQYHTQAGRALNAAIMREVPGFGSIIAMELEPERRQSDTFPTFMSVDLWNVRCPQLGSGMLHPRFAGLDLNTTSVFDAFGEGDGSSSSKLELEKRWEALGRMSEVSPIASATMGKKDEEYRSHYDYAFKLLQDARFRKALQLTDEEKKRYVGDDAGATKVGLELLLARNLLVADAGARFIYVGNSFNGGNGSFDNHENLYGYGKGAGSTGAASIYISAPRLDLALSNLVDDLSKLPGHAPGKTLLDETMIVLAHEFGRTPEMNVALGRDHYGLCFTEMYLGGGVKPGRVVGKTDEMCGKVVDIGWNYKQQVMKDHDTSTIYSALGIDYSKKIVDTPSGRAYEYQQTAPLGGPEFIPRTDIEPLFV
jgi:hypothetical protein